MKLVSQATSLGYLEPIDLQTLDVAWHKNISIKRVEDYPLSHQIKYLASLLPKPVKLFDLKIQDLEQRELPCQEEDAHGVIMIYSSVWNEEMSNLSVNGE